MSLTLTVEPGKIGEILETITDSSCNSFDPLSYWIENDEEASKNILLRNHKGSINDFFQSFISTDLRNTVVTLPELKAFILGMDKGLNSSMNAIDNENIIMFRINEKPDINSLDLTLYKNNELDRLNNTQSSLFLEDQKETANIKDNRTLVY